MSLFVMQSFAFLHINIDLRITLNSFSPAARQCDFSGHSRLDTESRDKRRPHPLGEECGLWSSYEERTGNYSSSHTLLYLRMTVQRFSTSLRSSSSSV